MTTGATTATAPTTAQLQMPTTNTLAPTTVPLRTATTGRRSDLQAARAHVCARCVYAAYACTAHNVKLLGEGREDFGAEGLSWSSSATPNRGMKQGDDFKVLKRFVNFKLSCSKI